ncbi:XRE family transcriptional regulator [Sphingomonas koreensis]|uniref:XRE family transcriptional regulator n=1 Tax=Sphingomonas koreensis TaxID=93064 RepID=UPI000B3052A6|nr:S24 family peptidase [Sphingomonas koreensis]PJI89053.1 phage repressor protein C with HTH and peptisase S24 domain [Sphingomonas koreensis]
MDEIRCTQDDLASAVGATQGAISMILNGVTRQSRLLPRIAENLGVNLGWLVGTTDDKIDMFDADGHEISEDDLAAIRAGTSAKQLQKPEQLGGGGLADAQNVSITADDMAEQLDLVPVDEISLEFGMGSTVLHDDLEIVRRYVPREWIAHFSKSHPSLLRFARGRGDSMYPTILDSDLVLIDMGETRLTRQDEIWAVGYGDLGGLKRLRSIGGGQIKVMSDNPTVSDEIFDMEEIRLIGRVCGNLRKM